MFSSFYNTVCDSGFYRTGKELSLQGFTAGAGVTLDLRSPAYNHKAILIDPSNVPPGDPGGEAPPLQVGLYFYNNSGGITERFELLINVDNTTTPVNPEVNIKGSYILPIKIAMIDIVVNDPDADSNSCLIQLLN
jgi:hypothetical protein